MVLALIQKGIKRVRLGVQNTCSHTENLEKLGQLEEGTNKQ